MKTKGIVLAGGSGTRLYPLTEVISKQLLPVYDKPLIYYPVCTLMLAGIRQILIISTPRDLPVIERLLGDGSRLGVRFSYKVQPKPAGIAQSFLIGEDFIGKDRVALILGDNLFHGNLEFLRSGVKQRSGAVVFAYPVKNPERYGVVEFDSKGKARSIEEKPAKPKSSYAVTGLYVYDSDVASVARRLKPSKRGELEITDLNLAYLQKGRLKVQVLTRGVAWLDAGTHQSLLDASNFIQTLEMRQGLKHGCIEEAAYRMGFINARRMEALIGAMKDSEYKSYLNSVLKEKI